MRPVTKMLLLLGLLIIGAALFFVILNDEDTGAAPLAVTTAHARAPHGAGLDGTGTAPAACVAPGAEAR